VLLDEVNARESADVKVREIARAALSANKLASSSEAVFAVDDSDVEAAISANTERRRATAAEHGECHDQMAEAIEASCGFTFSDYAFKYADVLYTTCEKAGGDVDKAVATVRAVCT